MTSDNNQKHWTLYVLSLEQEKWYIGITTKAPAERYQEHVENIRAAAWTRKYKPVKIWDTKDLSYTDEERAKDYESRVTLEYMRKYGVNNVRGGQYCEADDYVLDKDGVFWTKDVYEVQKISMRIIFWLLLMFCVLLYLYIYKVYFW